MKKKLSPAQSHVIDALLEDDKRYIKSSGYFNEQAVTDGIQNGFYFNFKKSTLVSLRNLDLFVFNKSDKTYRLKQSPNVAGNP